MGKHLSKYSSEADYNNNKDTHLKPHVSLITTSPKKIKFEKKILVNLITFYINNREYQAEEGMTWADFYVSEYNINRIISDSVNPNKNIIYNNLDSYIRNDGGFVLLYPNGNSVLFGDIIEPNTLYWYDTSSMGGQ